MYRLFLITLFFFSTNSLNAQNRIIPPVEQFLDLNLVKIKFNDNNNTMCHGFIIDTYFDKEKKENHIYIITAQHGYNLVNTVDELEIKYFINSASSRKKIYNNKIKFYPNKNKDVLLIDIIDNSLKGTHFVTEKYTSNLQIKEEVSISNKTPRDISKIIGVVDTLLKDNNVVQIQYKYDNTYELRPSDSGRPIFDGINLIGMYFSTRNKKISVLSISSILNWVSLIQTDLNIYIKLDNKDALLNKKEFYLSKGYNYTKFKGLNIKLIARFVKIYSYKYVVFELYDFKNEKFVFKDVFTLKQNDIKEIYINGKKVRFTLIDTRFKKVSKDGVIRKVNTPTAYYLIEYNLDD